MDSTRTRYATQALKSMLLPIRAPAQQLSASKLFGAVPEMLVQ
jgi:hypothetical protein